MALPISQVTSPNCGPRRNALTPTLVVLHYTAMHSAEAACTRLCDPAAEVSAHYLLARDGAVTQLVPEALRAWHAGAGCWQGLDDINSRSIGIELDNRGDHPFAAAQMDALEALLRGIMARWPVPPDGVIGHSDMAPGRKRDPGPHFDWARLARQGLAGQGRDRSDRHAADEAGFRAAAAEAGYPADIPLDTLLEATRLRYAPWRRGPLVAADLALGHGNLR